GSPCSPWPSPPTGRRAARRTPESPSAPSGWWSRRPPPTTSGPARPPRGGGNLRRRLVVRAVEGDGPDGVLRLLCRMALPLPGPGGAVFLLVLRDGRVPLVQVFVGDQVLVLLGDEQARLLVGEAEGRVEARRL